MKAASVPLPPLDGSRAPSSPLVPFLAGSGLYGYAARDGTLKIRDRFTEARPFYEGLAAVKEGDWGFVRTDGGYQIKPRYDVVGDFVDGNAMAWLVKEPWLGPIMHLVLKEGEVTDFLLDRTGKVLDTTTRRTNVGPWTPQSGSLEHRALHPKVPILWWQGPSTERT